MLAKKSTTDYDTQWIDPPSGGDPDAAGAEFTTTARLACLKYPYSGGHVVEVYTNALAVLEGPTYLDDVPVGFAPANSYAGGVCCASVDPTRPVDVHPVCVTVLNSRELNLKPIDATFIHVQPGTLLIKYMAD